MKRLFLDVQDDVLKVWLLENLQTHVVLSDERRAEVVVFTTESEEFEERCKTLTEAGCAAFVLTPENKGTISSKITRVGAKAITYRGRSDGISVLTRLAEFLIAPPAPEKKEIVVIYSAKQAGGSFVAWNLWTALTKLGVKVSLCSILDEASPFRTWIPEAPVYFGSCEGSEEDGIWIVDASGSGEVVDVGGDLVLVVHDADSSKSIPSIDGETIANRIWPDKDVSDLYIPDLGRLAVRAMRSHQAVVELDESVFRLFVGLWRYWHGEAIEIASDLQPEENPNTPEGRRDLALTHIDNGAGDHAAASTQESGGAAQEGTDRKAFSFDEGDSPSDEGRRFQFDD